PRLGADDLEALVCLTEAAVAFRSGDRETAARLAGKAAALWRQLDRGWGALLARCLELACGGGGRGGAGRAVAGRGLGCPGAGGGGGGRRGLSGAGGRGAGAGAPLRGVSRGAGGVPGGGGGEAGGGDRAGGLGDQDRRALGGGGAVGDRGLARLTRKPDAQA